MRIAILGAGRVGASLGAALKAKGHVVVFGAREPKVSAGFVTKTIDDAILSADAVILTTPWTAAEALVCEHAPALAAKTVIDATNPLNANATRLSFGFDTSGAELLQSHARHATFFKAFNVMGPGAMASPRYPQGLAAAFVAGPSGAQKDIVMGLARDVGFDAVDVGELRAARLLEPLSMLLMHLEGLGPWLPDGQTGRALPRGEHGGARGRLRISPRADLAATPDSAGERVKDETQEMRRIKGLLARRKSLPSGV